MGFPEPALSGVNGWGERMSRDGYKNKYAYYVHIPDYFDKNILRLYISSSNNFEGTVENMKITCLQKK